MIPSSGRSPGEGRGYPLQYSWAYFVTAGKGDLGSIPGMGRSLGEGKDYPLQYSGLENSMDCIVHGVTKSWTQLSDFHFDYLPSTPLGARDSLTDANTSRAPVVCQGLF